MKNFDCIGFDSSDYWSGYHLPCIQIPVYDKMTKAEVVDSINEELNMCWDMYESIMGKDDNEQLFNDYCNSLRNDPDSIGINPQYEHDLTEEEEPMYLYFSWVNPVTVGCITFMNP